VDALVRELGGSLFQRSGWRRCVAQQFDHTPCDLVAQRGGQIVGALALQRCRTPFGGMHLISSPYGVYGGPVGRSEEIRHALVDAALEEARARSVGRLELRSREPLEHPQLQSSDLYVTFEKPLPGSWEEVLSGMKKDERRLVRRAADAHGLVLDEGPWYVDELAELFHASKQRLGSPGLPVAWFRALQEELGPEVVLHRARRGDETLAVSLSFVDGDALRMYYIGTAPHANRAYSATSFMIAELQRWALERGLKVFDLGRSRRDAGAVKFKTNQGFQPTPLHYAYGLVGTQELPSFNPSNPRTAVLRRTWARLPAWLCVQLSGALTRYLP